MIQPQLTNTYPDVLGMLSGTRLNAEGVQCSLGIYPHGAAIGQPFEVLVLLQSMVDQPVPVTVTLRLPRKDAGGNRVSFFAAQDSVQATVAAGEVGLLHIPIMPQVPTPPGSGYVVNVSIEGRRPRGARTIRGTNGGRVAGVLPMSPHRLTILQNEVGFSAGVRSTGTQLLNALSGTFNIVPGHIMAKTFDMSSRYETLWNPKNLAEDQQKYASIEMRTNQLANGLTRTKTYKLLIAETERRFGQAGISLLAGEAIAVGKLLTYAMEDGLELEDGFSLFEGRWFQKLAALIDNAELIEDNPHLIAALYTSVLHDGARLGFHLLSRMAKETFGSSAEHSAQVSRLVAAMERKQGVELQFVYLPLTLAGLMLHARIKSSDEDLWGSLAQIRAAWQARSTSGALGSIPLASVIGRTMDDLLVTSEQFLIKTRVPRA